MSSPFIIKLKKEAQKSPGKAAVLALLLCVALWFWAPLFAGLLGGESTKVVAEPVKQTATLTTTSAKPAVPQSVATPWRETAAAIEGDPLMKPARVADRPRDVFQLPAPPKVDTSPLAETTAPAPAPELDVPPQSVGLALASTMIGPKQRVARLNGNNYHPGDAIEVTTDTGTLTYVLRQVSDRSVVLALGNKQYELAMPRRTAGTPKPSSGFVSSDDPDFDPSILEGSN